ncbi:MAG TPA: hypothetical protein VKN99_07355 [Polyangia bacterium]|nr:hypothetical protein [Polyangia bacterium]
MNFVQLHDEWVALDGDLVIDHDPELAELCARLQAAHRSHLTIERIGSQRVSFPIEIAPAIS